MAGVVEKVFHYKHRRVRFALYYFLWVLTGTLFFGFSPSSHTSGFIYGYYSAINIGYSIGWSWPPQEDGPVLLFSSLFLLFGAGFVGLALGCFAEAAMKDRDQWFTKLLKQREHEKAKELGSFWTKLVLGARFYKGTIIPVSLWLSFLFLMMLNGRYGVGWTWYTTQYFALTSCSTGGMVGISGEPSGGLPGAPKWSFLLHGFLTSLGVPFMAWAMASLGTLFVTTDKEELERTQKTIKKPIVRKELEFLLELGLEDGDGEIDRAEFIILCMVRMGIDVQLLQFISDRFNELDSDNSKTLSVVEATSGKFYRDKDGAIRDQESTKKLSVKEASGRDIKEKTEREVV